MQRGLLLNIIVGQSAAVLELFARKNQPLLVWRYSLFILYFLFDILDGVAGLDVQCDRFAGLGFYENLLGCQSMTGQYQIDAETG